MAFVPVTDEMLADPGVALGGVMSADLRDEWFFLAAAGAPTTRRQRLRWWIEDHVLRRVRAGWGAFRDPDSWELGS